MKENTAGQGETLGKEITQNPCRVATAHLVCGQTEVCTHEDVHKYGGNVFKELSGSKNKEIIIKIFFENRFLHSLSLKYLLIQLKYRK